MKVSPRQFQIFDLHVLQELPVARVSAILKVSPMSVYQDFEARTRELTKG